MSYTFSRGSAVLFSFLLGACGGERPIDGSAPLGGNDMGSGAMGGAATDAGTPAPSIYYDAGSPSSFPTIPDACSPVLNSGIIGLYTEYACPVDGGQVQNCANILYPCVTPPDHCPQPPPGDPLIYACENAQCFAGCADRPCPATPCPANMPNLFTCGPDLPSFGALACITVAQGADRFSVCCCFPGSCN